MAQSHMAAAQVVQQPTQTYLRDQRQMNITQNGHEILVRYIIDYCDKRGFTETSAHLRKESKINDKQKPPVDSPEGLLYEWWTCFWEIYTARVQPEKSANPVAKEYAQRLPHLQKLAAHDQGALGPGPTLRPMGAARPLYMNGTGPHPAAVNGHGPPFPGGIPTMNGVAPTANMAGVSGAGPTPLQNPSLQHLGPPRPGQTRPYTGPGNPGMPSGAQFAHPGQARMVPNTGPHPPLPPNARPGPGGQSSSPQMADSQMAGASSSPQQSNGINLADIPPPQLQEYLSRMGHPMTNDANTLPEHVKMQIRELHEQSGRGKNPRGTKRGSPGGEESLPKGDSPSDRKKPRRASQEPGNTLPSTPSITPVQPPVGPRPLPSNMIPPKGNIPPHPQALHPSAHHLGAPPYPDPLQTPTMAGQMAQLMQAQNQRLQSAPPPSQQANQQYFASLQQQAFTGYKPTQTSNGSMPPSIPNPSQPLNADPTGQFGRPPVGGTNLPKGAMLPPPLPNNASIPSPAAGGQVPSAKGTPIMSGAVPRGLGGIKDESSPSGVDGFSPEMARPASRPNPGSTPQAMPSAPTPSASAAGPAPTTGAPSTMSAPSPSQLATPQQTSRPQSQSPSATATARPSTATINGAPAVGSTPNQSAMLARSYPGAPSGPGNTLGGPPTNPSLAPGLLGGPSVNPATMDSNSNDLFGMALGVPFSGLDMQMMGFHEDSFSTLDFGLGIGTGEDTYNMFINDPADSVTG